MLAAGALPLCWRRAASAPVWVVVSVTAAVYGAAEWPDPVLPFAPIVPSSGGVRALLDEGEGDRLGALRLIAVLVATVVGDADALDWWLAALVLAAAPLAGDHLRQRRLLVEQAEARSRRLEAERNLAVADARAAERAVARRLHDVVAHHVTMLVVQAEAAASQHGASRTRSAASRRRPPSMSWPAAAGRR